MFLLEGIDKHASDFHDKLFYFGGEECFGSTICIFFDYLSCPNESHRLTWSVLESLNCQEPCFPGCHQAYNMDKFQKLEIFPMLWHIARVNAKPKLFALPSKVLQV